jgi:hypothetical protein
VADAQQGNAMIQIIIAWISRIFLAWLDARKRDQAIADAAVAKAEIETIREIKKVENEQVRNDAVDRGGSDSVLERLRKRQRADSVKSNRTR